MGSSVTQRGALPRTGALSPMLHTGILPRLGRTTQALHSLLERKRVGPGAGFVAKLCVAFTSTDALFSASHFL